jgi:hypothetical protein
MFEAPALGHTMLNVLKGFAMESENKHFILDKSRKPLLVLVQFKCFSSVWCPMNTTQASHTELVP